MADQHPFELPIPYPWQQQTWSELSQRHLQDSLHHGLLFAGVKGLGKSVLARCLANFVLCNGAKETANCGVCKACQLLAVGTHPDLFLLRPEGPGKAIRIDDVRALNKFLGQTSQQGGYKVAIIEPAEAMNINSSNALLKNLEEPTANTLLILLSHTPSRLMATIRSRCQVLPVPAPPHEQALAWLAPLCQDTDPEQLLAMTGGAPLAAKDMLDGDKLLVQREFSEDLLKISRGEMFSIAAVSRWMDAEPLFLIETLLLWVQGQLKAQAGSSVQSMGPAESLVGAADKIKFRFYDKLLQAKAQLLSGSNPNKQLLLEEMAMDWQAMTRRR